VIQIQDLPKRRRNELEKLLSIFDQTNHTQDFHILNVNEDDFSEKYRPVIRRLQAAITEPEVRKLMVAEDEFIEELEYKDREIAEQQEVISLQEQAIVEKEQVIVEKEQVIVEKEQVIVEKDKTIEEQLRLIEELRQQLNKK
jgi:hypothetical protein